MESSGLDPDIIDSLRYELDKRIYHYGAQFAYPTERSAAERRLGGIKSAFKEVARVFKKNHVVIHGEDPGVRISSNAYFSFNAALAEQGFKVSRAPWDMGRSELGNAGLYRRICSVVERLKNADFKELLTEEFASEIHGLKSGLKDYYLRAGIDAIVVPFDLPVFERLAIKIFKELGRSSFISLHGLPGRYNNIDDNRPDYLLVWGEKIKECYVRAGISPGKIFVTGHPAYRVLTLKPPRFSLDNVLVISKPMGGSQHCAEEILSDRGNLVLYLYSVRKVLEKAGVRHARLRLHPSESAHWYDRFVDENFFTIDKKPLPESLRCSSLLVGPTSTVFLESLLAGVDYLIYDPAVDGMDTVNYPLVPPFDGMEKGVPAAHNEDEFEKMLGARSCVDPAVLDGYIKTPFDLSFVAGLIAKKRLS